MTDFSPVNPPKTSENSDFGIPDMPTNLLRTYARVWQLETWLRQMVYVEFRALKGDDWEYLVPRVEKSQQPKEADKRLTHMPTREENPLSYVQFSQLCKGISEQWRLFEFIFATAENMGCEDRRSQPNSSPRRAFSRGP